MNVEIPLKAQLGASYYIRATYDGVYQEETIFQLIK